MGRDVILPLGPWSWDGSAVLVLMLVVDIRDAVMIGVVESFLLPFLLLVIVILLLLAAAALFVLRMDDWI